MATLKGIAGSIGIGLAATGAILTLVALPPGPPPAPEAAIPEGLKLSEPGVAWAGFVRPEKNDYKIARLFNDFDNPAEGLGPISDGPEHPYVNNEVAREMNQQPTFRVADLTNAAAQNLLSYAVEALKAQIGRAHV